MNNNKEKYGVVHYPSSPKQLRNSEMLISFMF